MTAILQIRVYALYSLNRKILTFMLCLYAITASVGAWSAFDNVVKAKCTCIGKRKFHAETNHTTQATAIEIPGGRACTFPLLLPNSYAIWIPQFIFETILCVLVLYKGYLTFKESLYFQTRGSLLVKILIRDSVLYFVT